MKTVGAALILILTTLIIPFTVFSAEVDGNKHVVGVIIEKSETGDYIQVGDYSISGIGTVVIKDSSKPDKKGSSGDFFIGALVDVVLADQNENGLWRASSVTLLLGDAQEEVLAELGEEQRDLLKETQTNLTAGEQGAAEPVVEEKAGEKPQEGKLRLENGVWVN